MALLQLCAVSNSAACSAYCLELQENVDMEGEDTFLQCVRQRVQIAAALGFDLQCLQLSTSTLMLHLLQFWAEHLGCFFKCSF